MLRNCVTIPHLAIMKITKLTQATAKKLLISFITLIFAASLTIFFASAGSTAAPSIDSPDSPVDAEKATITGTTEPDAKVIATGGPYQIAPIYADSSGDFEVTVALAQETTNIFFVYAQDGDNDISDSIQVTIIESAAQAQAYEEATGEDRTAPDAPEISPTEITTDELTYTIEGSGETGATVLVNNSSSSESTDNSGDFSVEVNLTGNGDEDKFSVTLMDDSNNLSPATKVYITSSTENDTTADDDNGEDNASGNSSDNGTGFGDLSGHWAENYIQTLYDLGAVSGYNESEFGPDNEVTRAQILKIALIAFGTNIAAQYDIDFNDVDSNAWYKEFISTAYEEGIVQGYDDGTFRPDDPVTRAEAIKIILKAASLTEYGEATTNFNDVSSGDWFSPYTAYSKELGFIGGYDDGSFRGNQSITRAEVCKIIVMVLEYLE